MPPQPAGVWNSVYNDAKWTDATGPNRYRRAIYTYIKRTSGYPSFLMFDASDRDTSLPRRIPTNTPLQALVTLNDPVYQEAAQALARARGEGNADKSADGSSADDILDARLVYETRLVLSRDPTPRELTVLRAFYQRSSCDAQAAGFGECKSEVIATTRWAREDSKQRTGCADRCGQRPV